MPPRKKLKASAIASGAQTTTSVSAFQDLPKLQRDALAIVDTMFGLRHADPSLIHDAPKGLLVPENGEMPFPITWGGTFVQIAQKAWAEPDKLLAMSSEFACGVGLLDAGDADELVQQYCKMDATRFDFNFFSWGIENVEVGGLGL